MGINNNIEFDDKWYLFGFNNIVYDLIEKNSESTNMTIMKYVKRKRMEKAQILMATTDKTLRQIASELNFYDAFHLSKVFKNTGACQ